MDTIKLPDGYNGHFVECECEPIEKDGDMYKLRVKGSYLIRWCTRQQWESAMYEAYTEEAYRSLESEYARDYQRMEREANYQARLKEESGLTRSRHSESCECYSCYERYCEERNARR